MKTRSMMKKITISLVLVLLGIILLSTAFAYDSQWQSWIVNTAQCTQGCNTPCAPWIPNCGCSAATFGLPWIQLYSHCHGAGTRLLCQGDGCTVMDGGGVGRTFNMPNSLPIPGWYYISMYAEWDPEGSENMYLGTNAWGADANRALLGDFDTFVSCTHQFPFNINSDPAKIWVEGAPNSNSVHPISYKVSTCIPNDVSLYCSGAAIDIQDKCDCWKISPHAGDQALYAATTACCKPAYANACDTTDGCGGTRSVDAGYNSCDLSSDVSCGGELACDQIDNNCNGIVDSDAPHYEAFETTCDELDNDCDGEIDEGCGCFDEEIESAQPLEQTLGTYDEDLMAHWADAIDLVNGGVLTPSFANRRGGPCLMSPCWEIATGGSLRASPSSHFDIAASESLSITGWFKTTADGPIVDRHGLASDACSSSAGTSSAWYKVEVKSGFLSYTLRGDSGSASNEYSHIGGTQVNDGVWHHFALVLDKESKIITTYVDGQADTRTTTRFPHLTDSYTMTTDLHLGYHCASDGTSDSFAGGFIDEVALYKKALSECEVRKLAFGPTACNDKCADCKIILAKNSLSDEFIYARVPDTLPEGVAVEELNLWSHTLTEEDLAGVDLFIYGDTSVKVPQPAPITSEIRPLTSAEKAALSKAFNDGMSISLAADNGFKISTSDSTNRHSAYGTSEIVSAVTSLFSYDTNFVEGRDRVTHDKLTANIAQYPFLTGVLFNFTRETPGYIHSITSPATCVIDHPGNTASACRVAYIPEVGEKGFLFVTGNGGESDKVISENLINKACGAALPEEKAQQEICNGQDDDVDGEIDEGLDNCVCQDVTVSCHANIGGVTSVEGFIDIGSGYEPCTLDRWIGTRLDFACDVGEYTGPATVKCAVDTTKSFSTTPTIEKNIVIKNCLQEICWNPLSGSTAGMGDEDGDGSSDYDTQTGAAGLAGAAGGMIGDSDCPVRVMDVRIVGGIAP